MNAGKIKSELDNFPNLQEVYIRVGNTAYPAKIKFFEEEGNSIPYIDMECAYPNRAYPGSYGEKPNEQTKEIKKTLEDYSAKDFFNIVYPKTLMSAIKDIQAQIDDSSSWLEKPRQEFEKLSEKEVFDLTSEIKVKTEQVKALLELYASYNHPWPDMLKLCRYYGIKTIDDAK